MEAPGQDQSGTRWAAVVFTVYLAVQLWVPLVRLTEERPSQFGWQMYSDVQTLPSVELVFPDSTVRVDLRELVVNRRLDLDYRPHLASHLCERTSAEAIILRRVRPPAESAHRCAR